MRKLIFLLIASISLSGCLNNDVLDKDLENSNFQESDFYTSGDFNNQFGLIVDAVELTVKTNPLGDTVCVPKYTLRLNDNFVAGLSSEWDDDVMLILYKDELSQGTDYLFTNNYGQSFEFNGQAIDCNATSSTLDARFELLVPNSNKIVASIEKMLTLNFAP